MGLAPEIIDPRNVKTPHPVLLPARGEGTLLQARARSLSQPHPLADAVHPKLRTRQGEFALGEGWGEGECG